MMTKVSLSGMIDMKQLFNLPQQELELSIFQA